jgi:methylenetetrahydrofolate reductase (NADPH)
MKIIDHISNAKNPLFSCEIVPPPRGRSVQDIIDIIDALRPFKPSWIDVTAHSASAYYNEKNDGSVQRRIYKKRPGTIGICGIIQNRFQIDTVVHLLCNGFTKEETEDALIELNFLGVHNILAIRGDGLNYKKNVAKDRSTNVYAADLVKQITELKNGHYIDDISNARPLDFCVGVAGYPEKHFEAANLKIDIQWLKHKVAMGADYIVTQMFFDNAKYFKFVKMCRDEGITVPIVPGLKIIKSVKQLQTIPCKFYIDMPEEFVDEITKNPNHAEEIGLAWSIKQARELLDKGVPGIHFYIMNDTDAVIKLAKNFW